MDNEILYKKEMVMDKKRALILLVLVAVIFAGIKIGKLVDKHQEKKFKANIENQLKTMYDKEFVVKEESSTEGVRWTVGLSKWKKTSYICYRKDIPEIEFEVDLDKEGKTIVADNYQRKRIEYEAFQYYKPFFDAISDKYYIISKMYFLKKGASSPQDDTLQEVDMPLYLELHKKTFKEIIERYSDYIEIGFLGRIYTDKNTDEIEDSIERIAYELAKTKICSITFSLGIYELSIFKNYETEIATGLNLNKDKNGFRGIVNEGEYWEQNNKEKSIKKIREAWQWQ
jgi:hypothetical protein